MSLLKILGIDKYTARLKDWVNNKIDRKVSDLVNAAPETLDTLGELATAIQENETIVDALDAAITKKADKSEIPTPDWNAKKRDKDFISNRTHYVNTEYCCDINNFVKVFPETDDGYPPIYKCASQSFGVDSLIRVETAIGEYAWVGLAVTDIRQSIPYYVEHNGNVWPNDDLIWNGIDEEGADVTYIQTWDIKQYENKLIADSRIEDGILFKLSEIYLPDSVASKDYIKKTATNFERASYSKLVALRDASKLIPGRQYRITDYVTTTAQSNTFSAGHQFDIIVTADDEKTLNEIARAVPHDGDTYFATSNLSAWKIWYCLENNTNRFAWADATNGKGVIYRMIDEWNNDCPYDFKNIQFMRGVYESGGIAPDGEEDMTFYLYTFSFRTAVNEIVDTSIFGNNGRLLNDDGQISGVYGNVIGRYLKFNGSLENFPVTTQQLNDIVFYSHYDYDGYLYYGCYNNSFGDDCYGNSFGNGCYSNSFGNSCSNNSFGNSCSDNSFGDDCYNNSFGNDCTNNSFGNSCSNNRFDNDCYNNSFGDDCYGNSFGNDCTNNSFGNSCYNNHFDNICYNNSFGDICYNNSFGDDCSDSNFGDICYNNSFGDDCSDSNFGDNCFNNSFGVECTDNRFGNDCSNNSFGNNCYNIRFGNYYRCNKLDERIYNVTLDNNQTASHNWQVQNYHLTWGLKSQTIEVERNRTYETTVAIDSSGNVKQFCIADIIL